ncbi:MAG: flagellin lysine-N-methylase [Lachnospiraceae bacterium]|nr:flagellin lysine-N-methylase [Lachnospiraceae bacterium]
MEIREISFFNSFQCAGGACSETCCRGWLIPLEEEDQARLKKERGLFWLKYRLATWCGLKDNFNSTSRYCPFFNKDGLCSMQLQKGHDFIPEVCRSYPRYYRNNGCFEERMIDLSCIEGAKLWFENCFDFSFRIYDGAPESGRYGSNDEEDFLHALESVRKEMADSLLQVKTANELNHLLSRIDAYGEAAQKAYLNEEKDFLGRQPFATYQEKEAGDFACFPYDGRILAKILRTHLYSERLSVANPTLYRLCRSYIETERATKDMAGLLKQLFESFLKRYERYVPYYGALYAYYLYQNFLNIYDDYSFRRNLRLGMIHLNVKFLFDVLMEHDTGTFGDAEFVRSLTVYNRRAYFNETIKDEMYRALEEMTAPA